MPKIHYYASRKNGREEVYYVARLWRLVADLPVVEVAIETLDLDKAVWFHNRCPPLTEVIEHFEKVLAADLDYPIILSSTGKVMDGFHRIVKAKLQGSRQISAVRFEVDPEPDEVRLLPDRKKSAKRPPPASAPQAPAPAPTVNDADGYLNHRRLRLAADLAAETERLRAAVADQLSPADDVRLGSALGAACEEIHCEIDRALIAVASADQDHGACARIALELIGRAQAQLTTDDRFAFLSLARNELGMDLRYDSILAAAFADFTTALLPLAAIPEDRRPD